MTRPKRDPLIAAMIAKLPETGDWPVDRQLAWLSLMAMAFGTVYGGDAAAHLGKTEVNGPRHAVLKELAKLAKPAYPFYIGIDGKAYKAPGTPINAKDVKGDLYDMRGELGDMKTIVWADGSTGLNGADLTIVAV